MPQCIGVKFSNGPKIHYVQLESQYEPVVNSNCVVSTRRGLEIAVVRTSATDVDKSIGYFVRDANKEDLSNYNDQKDRAEELKWLLKARVKEKGFKAKVVNVEFNLDESLVLVSYTSEENVPLKEVAKELKPHTQARVEFVNIGPRDQARLLGTIGVCGDGSCSSTWMQSFNAVGIRMARDQQLPLNPEKISGPCGRLMCCLQFEHDMYEKLLKGMPRKGNRACHTESGTCGKVIKLYPLKESIEMITDEGVFQEYPVSDIEIQKKKTPQRTKR